MEQKKITQEDQKVLKDMQANIQYQKMSIRASELEYENFILKLYVKYGLKESDTINLDTCEIKSSIDFNQQ